MKTLITVFIILFITALGHANDKYIAMMQKNIEGIYKAETIEDLQLVINAFDRVAQVEKEKWEPHYYSTFGYLMMSTKTKETTAIDSYLDLAVKSLDKAKQLKPDDSEIVTLEGFIYMMRVSADPAARGAQLSGLSFQLFGKALVLNPDNPRALALMAQMQFGTAQFFKAPITEACNTVLKSLEKFEAFKSDNPLAPLWGKGMAESMKAQCQ